MPASRLIRHRLITSAAALSLFIGATPLFAQDDAASTRSFWSLFFYDPQWDFVGVANVWVLILLSMLCMGYTIHLLLRYRRSIVLPEATYNQLQQMLDEKRYRDAIDFADRDPSYLGKLVGSALNEASNGYPAMERAVEEAGDVETTRYLRPIEYLNVVGNIAPMLGLFGTVYGMVVAFQKLVDLGGRPDPVQLAGGISTALVTTIWGLIVAIPTLAAYALIRNKVDALTSEGLLQAEQIISPFKPAGKKSSPSRQERPAAQPKPGG